MLIVSLVENHRSCFTLKAYRKQLWAKEVMERHPDINKGNIMDILKDEIGQVFLKVLLCAGVFKDDGKGREAFKRFTDSL